MKNIYLIGGPMGVGKTAVCRQLKLKTPNSVFLDGDWCWDSHPFQVTEETKAMVLDNICYLLNNFIACQAYDTVIFCWVMHQQSILDHILSALPRETLRIKSVSLVCDSETLRQRLENDVAQGLRQKDVIDRSLEKLSLYKALDTIKLDTSYKTIAEIVQELIAI